MRKGVKELEGINLAEEKSYWFRTYCTEDQKQKTKCVFISHKKEDSNAAESIGKYLTLVVGVNIYLDQDDVDLQEAVSEENDKKIVDSIKRGLSCSTHLLCLISDKTHLSWWVPYEIGTADSLHLDIASLKLKDIDDLPSFLKTQRILLNIDQFLEYTQELLPYGGIFANDRGVEISSLEDYYLSSYLD